MLSFRSNILRSFSSHPSTFYPSFSSSASSSSILFFSFPHLTPPSFSTRSRNPSTQNLPQTHSYVFQTLNLVSPSYISTTRPSHTNLFQQQNRSITIRAPPDARTERFWELWNEEIKAIRQGREFTPKDLLFMRSLFRNRTGLSSFTKTVLFVVLFYLFFSAIKDYQMDRKVILKKVDKRLEEALQRVLPVVKLTLEHDIAIVLRAESKKYTIVGQHRFFSMLFRYFDSTNTQTLFSLYEKCFLVQCEVDLVIVGAKGASTKVPRRVSKPNKEETEKEPEKPEDQPIVQSLKAPIKCYVQVSRVGGITKVDSIKLEFVGEDRKLRIPADPKPGYEWSWHALAFTAKI